MISWKKELPSDGIYLFSFHCLQAFWKRKAIAFWQSAVISPWSFVSLVTVVIPCKVLLFGLSTISIFFFVVYDFSFAFVLMWGLACIMNISIYIIFHILLWFYFLYFTFLIHLEFILISTSFMQSLRILSSTYKHMSSMWFGINIMMKHKTRA